MNCKILDKTRIFCTGAGGESLSFPESAWIAKYSLKHSDSAQVESKVEWSRAEWSGVRAERSGVECRIEGAERVEWSRVE